MLKLYRSWVVKRECVPLSWSIPAALTHIESNDGRDPLPRPDAGSDGVVKDPSDGNKRWGPSQFVLSDWDVKLRPVVVFRVYPNITPDEKPKASNFNNPNNPWDTGYADDINAATAIQYGWSGANVDTWDYSAGTPLYYIDKGSNQRKTDYEYDPSTHGPLGDLIPYYRVQDGQGNALDGDGDGKADIMNPADSVPASARFLCAHGGGTLGSPLITAIFTFHPVWWILDGGWTPDGKETRGVLVLAKQLTQDGPVGPDLNSDLSPPGAPLCVSGQLALSSEQQSNADLIKSIGGQIGIPQQGIVLAEWDSYQESKLINLPLGAADSDSQGLFGQRASQGWGTIDQLQQADYQILKFYQALLKTPGWQDQPELDAETALTVAEAIQHPDPAAYLSPKNYFPGWKSLAEEIVAGSCSVGGSGSGGGNGSVVIAADADRPGVDVKPQTMAFLEQVANIYGKPLICTTGTDHSKDVFEGGVDTGRQSDHWDGYACDFGMNANGGSDSGPVGDAIAAACLIAAGEQPPELAVEEASQGDIFNRDVGGLHIQCIWKVEGHYDHVHIGANPT
jgi:hypothetical protein